MEYVYAAMLLHSAEKEIDENGVSAVLNAAGVDADGRGTGAKAGVRSGRFGHLQGYQPHRHPREGLCAHGRAPAARVAAPTGPNPDHSNSPQFVAAAAEQPPP